MYLDAVETLIVMARQPRIGRSLTPTPPKGTRCCTATRGIVMIRDKSDRGHSI